MAGEQTEKPDSSAGPFHWFQESLVFSCWDIHLSVHSKTFKSFLIDLEVMLHCSISLWPQTLLLLFLCKLNGLMILFGFFSFLVSSAFTLFSQHYCFFQNISHTKKKSIDLLDLTRAMRTVLIWPLPA